MQWRIGDVKSMRLWLDPWVPGLSCLKDFAWHVQVSNETTKVSSIINNRGDWDEDLILPLAVSEILKIRLRFDQHEDRWVWAVDKEDKFSVKSAFKFFCNIQNEARGECFYQIL